MASELIERDLYNGLYKMVHNPNAKGRQARYTITNTETGEITKPKGVTTVLGAVLAKDFVGWALDCMEEYLVDKLPVITAEDLTEAKLESNRRRDKGASTGSDAHALVESFLKGREPDLSGASKEAMNAYNAFVKWFNSMSPKVVNVEEVTYSAEYDVPGTYDCILEINNKVYLCDLKTTNPSRKAPNGVYAENFIQLGAYYLGHEEQRNYENNAGGSSLREIHGLAVISAKKNGKLDFVTNEDIGLSVEDCASMFKRIVNLFSFMQYTTKQLGGK